MPSVTIRGGGRLRRFIVRSQQLSPEVFASFAVEILRAIVLPQLRSRVPLRTGRLKRTLRFVRSGAEVKLVGDFYAPLVRWEGGRKSVAGEAMDVIENSSEEIRHALVARVRRYLES